MGNKQVGQPQLLLKLFQQGDDLRLDGDVQRGGGLIKHQKVGLKRQCPRNANALLLAAGELVWVTSSQRRVQAHHVHQRRKARGLGLRVQAHALYAQGLQQGGSQGVTRVNGGIGVLKHHLHAPAQGT